MVALLAAGPRATVRKEPAVKVSVEGFEHFVPQAAVLRLIARLPLPRQLISAPVHDPVQRGLFRAAP